MGKEFPTHIPEFRYVSIAHGQKAPIVANWQKSPHGWDKVVKIGRRYLGKDVGAIGLVLGVKSGGIVAVDCDGVLAEQYLGRLNLPPTLTVSSGKQGHWARFYRVPETYWEKAKTRMFPTDGEKIIDRSGSKCGDHFELRWNGQSIVMGLHPEGRQYQVLETVESFEAIPELPEPLLTYLVEGYTPPPALVAPEPRKSPPRLKLMNGVDIRIDAYLAEVTPDPKQVLIDCINTEYRAWIADGIPEGMRNDCAHKIACDLIGTARALQDHWGVVTDPYGVYMDYCARCAPPFGSDNPKEPDSTWRSAERSNPTPCLELEKIRNCLYHHLRRLVEAKSPAPRPKAPSPSPEPAEVGSGKPTKGAKDKKETLTTDELYEQLKEQLRQIYHAHRRDQARVMFELEGVRRDWKLQMKTVELIYESVTRAEERKFTIVSAAELDKEPTLEDIWIVPELFRKGVAGFLFGAGGTGKTRLSYQLAAGIAKGQKGILGRYNALRPHKVLFIQIDEAEVDTRLTFATHKELCVDGLDVLMGDILAQDLDYLEQLIVENGYEMVFIDSYTILQRGTGVEEKDTKYGMTAAELNRIANRTGANICFLHHTNKAGEHRGTTAIRDNVSYVIEFRRPNPEIDGVQMAQNKNLRILDHGSIKDRMGVNVKDVYAFDDDGLLKYVSSYEAFAAESEPRPQNARACVRAWFNLNPTAQVSAKVLQEIDPALAEFSRNTLTQALRYWYFQGVLARTEGEGGEFVYHLQGEPVAENPEPYLTIDEAYGAEESVEEPDDGFVPGSTLPDSTKYYGPQVGQRVRMSSREWVAGNYFAAHLARQDYPWGQWVTVVDVKFNRKSKTWVTTVEDDNGKQYRTDFIGMFDRSTYGDSKTAPEADDLGG